MARSGHDATHCENAFGLTLPEKRAVELRLADERAWLITNIDEIGGNHRDGKRDRDRVALGNLSVRRLDHNAAGIRFCIRWLFFLVVLSKCRGREANNQGADNEQCETAKCGRGLGAPTDRRAKAAPTFPEWPVHHFRGASCWIRRRSASASAVFPMRRWHCSRSVNATSDSLISIDLVWDATAAGKSARCRSRTPRKNQMFESWGSNSVAMRAC